MPSFDVWFGSTASGFFPTTAQSQFIIIILLLSTSHPKHSALHLDVEAYDMPFLAQFLLQYRVADINYRALPAPVGDATAPLHAVLPDNIKALRLLLASGADQAIRDWEERTALDVVCATWAHKQAKKRARPLLTRRSPFQAYALHKLRFLARSWSQGHGDEEERRQGTQPSSSSSPKVDDLVAGLHHTTMRCCWRCGLRPPTRKRQTWRRKGVAAGRGRKIAFCLD